MFYIEKNEKINFLEKKLELIKKDGNQLFLPITTNEKNKKIERIAKKIKKFIEKNSSSKKIVLSKEIQKEKKLVNYLNSYGFKISDGKFLFEILEIKIIKYIIEKMKMDEEKTNISILLNDLTEIQLANIKELAKKYKNFSIVTYHIEKFRRIENELYKEGIVLTLTNSKKNSLARSKIILNVDFPNEILNKYIINENAIIIDIYGNSKINRKRFNGICINDYEIILEKRDIDKLYLNENYYKKDIYESEIYKKQNYSKIMNKIKIDNVEIEKLFSQNSEL